MLYFAAAGGEALVKRAAEATEEYWRVSVGLLWLGCWGMVSWYCKVLHTDNSAVQAIEGHWGVAWGCFWLVGGGFGSWYL